MKSSPYPQFYQEEVNAMANVQARRDKSGKLISYSIRVHRGRDADGRRNQALDGDL